MKPFILVGDHYINIATILYVRALDDGALWLAFDLDDQKGLRIEGQLAQELKVRLDQLVQFVVPTAQ